VALFELARYSLHPLDDTARLAAMAYLEQLQAHLQQGEHSVILTSHR
jgi:hypothetical protein